MTPEEFNEIADEATVSCCFHDYRHGNRMLEQRLWEALRIRMQNIYRRSTGERDAVLTITSGGSAQK